MSLLRQTIEAFPRGRSTEELLVLLDAAFDQHRRQSILVELDQLLTDRVIRRGSDGRWRSVASSHVQRSERIFDLPQDSATEEVIVLRAARAAFGSSLSEPVGTDETEEPEALPDPHALLRYWRSALRADPRGAIKQAPDRHGVDWHLVTGSGPIQPDEGATRTLTIDLNALAPGFREALLRREANEKSLALGWPVAAGRETGTPVLWPVGLFSAEWRRTETHLVIVIEADDVLLNPDWLKAAARATSWSRTGLLDVFNGADGPGLSSADFLLRLREAMGSQLRGRLTGEQLAAEVDPEAVGMYDIAGLFLPTDSTFTAGAVRDLDTIATWPKDRLGRTALAPVLGLKHDQDTPEISCINVGALNAEQIRAVHHACAAPLSVVTGPPGTGKSQAIVSMAASIVAEGGRVLVASKNHQALDAVEDRLGSLAPESAFLVRTLDPEREVDRSFTDVLTELLSQPSPRPKPVDVELHVHLRRCAEARRQALDKIDREAEIECELADLLERIARREEIGSGTGVVSVRPIRRGWLSRLLAWFAALFRRKGSASGAELGERARQVGAPLSVLLSRVEELRRARANIGDIDDPVKLTEDVASQAKGLLPAMLAERVSVSEDRRQALLEAKDNHDFAGDDRPLPTDLARELLIHRPVWLASILGTPRRVPLDDGLFDLVIFDEASQCDIASALPLFARSKRAVVVGDNQQLRFISQLGREQDRNLMQSQGLPVARMGRYAQSLRSLFDFAYRVPGVPRMLLRHQYRSAGPIIEYVSDNFYGGRLTTSYDPETLKPPRGQKPGIAWTDVPASGVPQRGNANPAEAKAIADHLEMLLLEQDYEGTVGVIAPFNAQVETLNKEIRSRVPDAKWYAAELRIATVDRFQGQERDVILFSPCLSASSPWTAATFIRRDYRRLNVAISRARAVAHVFGDLAFARSGKIDTLRRLAACATDPPTRSGEGVFDSDWERKVYHNLKGRGLDPQPQYAVAGRRLDFALFGDGGIKLDLEVDGRHWHQDTDGRRKLADHWRDHQLKSLGWRVRRFWVDQLAGDMEACIDLVERDLA